MNTVRTFPQLAALFADGPPANISAQDGRDFIVSAQGWISLASDPTVNNDNVDTAALGATFDAGSRWTNQATHTVWACITGPAGAAVWVPVAGGTVNVTKIVYTPVPRSSITVPFVLFVDNANGLVTYFDGVGFYILPGGGGGGAFYGSTIVGDDPQFIPALTSVDLQFANAPIDTAGGFLGGPGSVDYTITKAGKWRIDLDITSQFSGANPDGTITLFRNGTATPSIFALASQPTTVFMVGGYTLRIFGSYILALSLADAIKFQIFSPVWSCNVVAYGTLWTYLGS